MGKAAEHAVASQLLLRGVSPLWPIVDLGYDLMTDASCRIQIKSSHIDGQAEDGQGYYWFPLGKSRCMIRGNQAVRVALPDISEKCDVVVFWGIEQNRFWIVPSKLCRIQGVALGLPDPERFVGSITAIREMVSLGYSKGKIAKHYGVGRHTIFNLLRSTKDFQEANATTQMRLCEGHWEPIVDFVKSVAVSTPAQTEKE